MENQDKKTNVKQFYKKNKKMVKDTFQKLSYNKQKKKCNVIYFN